MSIKKTPPPIYGFGAIISFCLKFISLYVIQLKYNYRAKPVIRSDKIKDLGMDFIIKQGFTESLGNGIIIELYPKGLTED